MAPEGGGRQRRGRRKRLSRSAEFDRVYREGTSRATRFLVLYRFPSTTAGEGPRLGVSVGRKVGGAVERNRMKRMLRDAFWKVSGDLPSDHDYVLVARQEAAKLADEQGGDGIAEALAELVRETPGKGGGEKE